MAATVTTTRKNPAARRVELEQLHGRLQEQVTALATSSGWKRFLDFSATFHRYSLNNQLLILSQRPDATQVAGFRAWQKKGRQVRKGERGIAILGYTPRVIDVEEETGTAETRVIPRYRVLRVFDISQTDPIPGQEPPAAGATLLQGQDDMGILTGVARFLELQGWSFERATISGAALGYTTVDGSRQVVVDQSLSPAQAAKTALHEAAHVLLHSSDTYEAYVAHRGRAELEAESVAYLTAGVLGLDTAAYSVAYVTGWAGADLDLLKTTATRVVTTSAALLAALAPADEE